MYRCWKGERNKDGWYVLSLVQFMYLGAVRVHMESSQNENQSREGLKRYI